MSEDREDVRYSAYVAAIAGGMLAIARLGTYLDVVNDTDVAFVQSLAWWGSYVAGVGLLAVGLRGTLVGETRSDRAWWAMAIGLLVLVLMPAAPVPNVDLGQLFGAFS